ncbi:MAG: thioredoxin family protein [Sphingobacteriia bacterium]
MKTLILMIAAMGALAYAGPGKGYQVGDKVRDFELENVDGKLVKLADYGDKKALVVIFTCNHCPYSKAYENRIIQLQKEYGEVAPVLAINPNAPTVEDDSYEQMKTRAREKGFTFPYLLDADQAVAQRFGAERTPHTYLLKRVGKEWVVAYTGAIDDNAGDEEGVQKSYLADAIEAVAAGKAPEQPNTKAIGCTIKWQ